MSEANKMRCYVCDRVGDWLRPTVQIEGKTVPIHAEMTTQICRNCGNACHDVDVSKEAEIKEFYRTSYRPQPTTVNLITTTHKQNYIRTFLKDFLQEASKNNKQLLVGDVGAATGYLCNFFRGLGHKATGCELTRTYRRMSEHYYGIPLTEELEPKHKYDLITIYHVLEHMMEPDKKLAHYASLLAEGGHMLIATPFWFSTLEEASGSQVQSFENLFHKNHINLFSKVSLQNLFRKSGLTIVKEDFDQYGQTYLIKKSASPVHPDWMTKEDAHEVERIMLVQKKAIDLYNAGKFREAYEAFPDFPDAWIGHIFHRCAKDLAKQMDVMSEADKFIGHSYRYKLAKSQWLYQQGRLAEAIQGFQDYISLKPNEDTFVYLGYSLAQAGKTKEAIQALQIACSMDPRKWQEAQTWILAQCCQLPTWDERAMIEAQQAFLIKQKPEAQPEAHGEIRSLTK